MKRGKCATIVPQSRAGFLTNQLPDLRNLGSGPTHQRAKLGSQLSSALPVQSSSLSDSSFCTKIVVLVVLQMSLYRRLIIIQSAISCFASCTNTNVDDLFCRGGRCKEGSLVREDHYVPNHSHPKVNLYISVPKLDLNPTTLPQRASHRSTLKKYITPLSNLQLDSKSSRRTSKKVKIKIGL